MDIDNIKNFVIVVGDEKFNVVELKVSGEPVDILDEFLSSISDWFSVAWDNYDEELGVMTMTFDKINKVQTMTSIKKFTLEYIKNMEHLERKGEK